MNPTISDNANKALKEIISNTNHIKLQYSIIFYIHTTDFKIRMTKVLFLSRFFIFVI